MAKNYRLFAAVYDPLLSRAERTFYPEYRRRAAGGARGRVLEIGAGSGANLSYYAAGVELTVADANIHMLRRLKAKAADANIKVDVHHVDAEDLPFDDESFDTVVATLMLCSVDDQARTLSEAWRVLIPGGEIRFVEHVKAPGRGWANAAFPGSTWAFVSERRPFPLRVPVEAPRRRLSPQPRHPPGHRRCRL